MEKKNMVFIARSIDGFIADSEGGIDWLNAIPNPNQNDMGYVEFTSKVDALLMGRNTFETILSFDIEWPYDKMVFVLSNTLKNIPSKYEDKAILISGKLRDVLDEIHALGYYKLYIDGGKVIQSFLSEDLIDDLIISTIPIILGKGISLFSALEEPLQFEHVESKLFLKAIVQDHYRRKR